MSVFPKDVAKDDFLNRLVQDEILNTASANRVRAASQISGTPVERAILELGLANEESVYRALAEHLGLRFIEASEVNPDLPETLGLDASFLDRVEAVPVQLADGELLVATTKPGSQAVLQSIAFYLTVKVLPALTSPSIVQRALERSLGADKEDAAASDSDVERLRALANDGPIIKYVNDVVAKAVSSKASDIHFETQEVGARVRFRVDGSLGIEGQISADRLASVVSRVKVMADLNISEKRRPQDGRITVPVHGRNIDIRVSTLPTQFGESIVMRLLDQERVELDWASLGFQSASVKALRRIVTLPNGIFLVAGPTGSGKTTTLYTALKEINRADRKIVTVEDPIEYTLPGINQTQVDPGIGMTFATALRAILRQDPDVVMVGEIRDEETAEIAVRAALIGRMVLSTIHTNDSIAAVTRLRDLGVPSYLLASTLRGVLSQRLVQRVCQDCGGVGCEHCKATGLNGRQVISELLAITPEISQSIANDEPATALKAKLKEAGFLDLRADAQIMLDKGLVRQGSIEQAISDWSD